MLPLPNDLIQVILDSHENWRYRDLVSLARVNSFWLAHVRLALYRQPKLSKFSSLYLLVRSLTAENGTELLPLITGLELCPVSDDDSGFLCQSAAMALGYLLGLPVQQLILGGALAIRAERFLQMISMPHAIQKLCIAGDCSDIFRCSASLQWDESMCRFTDLQVLELRNLELKVVPSPFFYEIPLSQLTLSGVHAVGHLVHLGYDPTSLKRLSVSCSTPCEFDQQLRLVLENSALESLYYEVQQCGSSCLLDSITCIPSMNSLCLNGVLIEKAALNLCFPNLVSLSVSGCSR